LLNYIPDGAVGQPQPFGGLVYRLNAGDTVDSTRTFDGVGGFINNNGANNANWAAGTTGYLGLRLVSGGNTFYGWARISYNSDQSLTVYDFAYNNTPGTPIVAGDTGAPPPPPECPRHPHLPAWLLHLLHDILERLPCTCTVLSGSEKLYFRREMLEPLHEVIPA
jgi:hypothetical protein